MSQKQKLIKTELQLRQIIHFIDPEFLPFHLRKFEAIIIYKQASRGSKQATKLARQQALLSEALDAHRRGDNCDYLIDFVKHVYGPDRAKRYAASLQFDNEQAEALRIANEKAEFENQLLAARADSTLHDKNMRKLFS